MLTSESEFSYVPEIVSRKRQVFLGDALDHRLPSKAATMNPGLKFMIISASRLENCESSLFVIIFKSRVESIKCRTGTLALQLLSSLE